MLVGVGIYLLYDWLRDQAAGVERRRVPARDPDRRRREVPRPVPGVLDPAGVPQPRLVHVVLEHLVRDHPLRDAGGRAGVALPQAAGALRALAQHARAHARRRRSWRSGPTRSCRRGSCPARFGFVDTAAEFFNFGPQVRVHLGADGQPTAAAVRTYGNLFAAMPSLHVGLVDVVGARGVAARCGARGRRCCWALYPVSIFFCIVVTANHWILDAVGGWIVLAARLPRRARHRVGAQPPSGSASRGHVICATA